jgi:hypothetical protein
MCTLGMGENDSQFKTVIWKNVNNQGENKNFLYWTNFVD